MRAETAAPEPEEEPPGVWPGLAGLAVGMGGMEAFDIGAIFSVVTAMCVVVHAVVTGQNAGKGLAVGCGRVAVGIDSVILPIRSMVGVFDVFDELRGCR